MRKAGGALSFALFLSLTSVIVAIPAHASDAAHVLRRSGGTPSDGFASSIDVSRGAAIIGAPFDQTNGYLSGAAYIFERGLTSWGQSVRLHASGPAEADAFAHSVTISGDVAAAGTPGDDDRGSSSGSASVFRRTGGVWRQEAKLTASDGSANDLFGWAMDADGATLVVGAPYDDVARENSGAAYVFTRSGSGWSQQAKLTVSDPAVVGLGSSVGISGDRAIVGGSGGAFVFTRSGSSWSSARGLVPSDAPVSSFGNAVAISGDRAIVGAPLDDDGRAATKDEGSAYVFVLSGGTWVQETKLKPSVPDRFDRFGGVVSIAGTTAVVSTPYPGNYTGSAWVFRRGVSGWIELDILRPTSPRTGHRFGLAASIASGTIVVGAPSDAAFVYEVPALSARGITTVGLEPDGSGFRGVLGRPYQLALSIANDGEDPVTAAVELGERGSYPNGDVQWGPRRSTGEIPGSGVGSVRFDLSHSWQWTEHTSAIPDAAWARLSRDLSCADLASTFAAARTALDQASSASDLADAAARSLSTVDTSHTYTYERRAGTTTGLTFDPFTVQLLPSTTQLGSFIGSINLGLGAKAWACAGWLGAQRGIDDVVAPAYVASAVAAHAADLLYRSSWDPAPTYDVVPVPGSYSFDALTEAAGWRGEFGRRAGAIAELQVARIDALRRYEAAMRDGAYAAAIRQLGAAARWTGGIADLGVMLSGLADSFIGDLPQTMSASEHTAFADAIGQDGLPGMLRGALADVGVGPARISALERAWAIAPTAPGQGNLRSAVSSLLELQLSAERGMARFIRQATTEAYAALGMPDAIASPPAATPTGWYTAPPSVSVQTPGGARVDYRIDDGPWQSYSGSFVLGAEGVHELLTRAIAGTLVQDPPRATLVRIDRAVPDTTTVVPGPWNRKAVVLELDVSDVTSGVGRTSWSVRPLAGGTSRPGTGRLVAFDDEGEWRLTFSSIDVAGNIEPATSVTVRIDLTPPASTIEQPLAPTFVRTVDLTGTATDATSGVANVLLRFRRLHAVNGTPVGEPFMETANLQGGSWSFQAPLPTGRYRVWPEATDVAGHVEVNAQDDAIDIVVV